LFEDVCEQLEALDKKYNLNIFRYHLRISSIHRQRWDENFMKENLLEIKENITKIFVVGPVPFMDDVKRDVLLSGVANSDQIVLV
jgi:hypothetical protein